MIHRRSPTHSYPHNTPSTHPALALRPSIPTLLSPLRPISNTSVADDFDDFQSNAWLNAPTYRTPLAGLGINYLRDDGIFSLHQDATLRMQVDDDQTSPALAADTGDFIGSIVSFSGPTGLDGGGNPTTSGMVGLIPDVNMFDRLRPLDLPCVNPLDTIRSTPLPDLGTSYGEPALLTPEHDCIDNVPSATDPKVEQSPSPRIIQDIMSILVQPGSEISELPFSPWSPVNSLSGQGLSPLQLAAPVSIKLDQEHDVPDGPLSAPEYIESSEEAVHSSPVLNAHLGIELSELISRAERFRTRHPDRDIDRAWLSHFAGKLSDRGELLTDFRCYVIGCDQRNKRRDHILVHVGAHIGQRPFACSMCPLRFLRKNECKRHEASHSGFRPYNCDICGQSFVRQDLVKRHVKRTHETRDENQRTVPKQTRRRVRQL